MTLSVWRPGEWKDARVSHGKSGKSGRRLTKWKRAHFVAWDGEGFTLGKALNSEHIYGMLLSSEGHELVNLHATLPTRDCLELLASAGEQYPHSIHVGFGFGYDVNMILADATREQVAALWRGEETRVGQFMVEYRQRKSLRVRRLGAKRSAITIWDVFGFFQTAFVVALEKYLGEQYAALDMIAHNKQKRATFNANDVEEIKRYCRAECVALVELMRVLHSYLDQAGLQISRFDGAGACAAALMKREDVAAYMSRKNPRPMPLTVERAAQHAYAGGRMEVMQYGHMQRPIFHYDINSAYPAAMRFLPSLAHGKWTRVSALDDTARDAFAIYYVRWNWSNDRPFYPLFWRAPDCNIYFPQWGEGWYWQPEIAATLDAIDAKYLKGRIEFLDGYRFVPSPNAPRPFAWLEPLYRQRQEWKAQGIGAEKVVKLAINSLYGKTAQHVGGGHNGAARPTYHELCWAGYITSATRAMLFRAGMQQPNDIIMFATDGIYSLRALDLPCSNALGEWSSDMHSGLTVVQSGVYWTDNKHGEEMFCRGFDKGSLNRQKILRAWKRKQQTYKATLTRFLTMGSALAGDKLWTQWRTWKRAPRLLALTPDGTKRYADGYGEPHKGAVRTYPRHCESYFSFQHCSYPYPLPWDDETYYPEWKEADGVPFYVWDYESLEATL